MPYAPGIQDISGQLIAQGMSQAGAARARAIESLGESIAGGMKQYQQNQIFTNQALGKFGLAMQDPTFKSYVQGIANDDPNAPQVPEPIKKAIKNIQAGKTDIYDAALVGSLGQDFQQNQLISAQARNVLAEAKAREFATKQREAAEQSLTQFQNALRAGQLGGQAAAVPTQAAAPVQPAAPMPSPEMLRFAAPGAAAQQMAAAPEQQAPEAAAAFLQSARAFAMPQVTAAPTRAAAPAAAAPSTPTATALNKNQLINAGIPPEWVAAIPPQVPLETVALAYEQTRKEAVEKGSSASTFVNNIQKWETLRRQGLAESQEMDLNAALRKAQEINAQQADVDPSVRVQAVVKGTTRPNSYIIETQPKPTTEEEAQKRALALQEQKERGTLTVQSGEAIRDQASRDRAIIPALRMLKALYTKDEKTGESQLTGSAFTAAKGYAISLVKGLGFPVTPEMESAQRAADLGQSLANQLITPYFNTLKGGTSDKDVQFIRSFGPSLATNPDAALAMLDIMERRIEYNQSVEEEYNKYIAEDITRPQLYNNLRQLNRRFNESIAGVSKFAEKFNLTAADATGGGLRGQTQAQPAQTNFLKLPTNISGPMVLGADGQWKPIGSKP